MTFLARFRISIGMSPASHIFCDGLREIGKGHWLKVWTLHKDWLRKILGLLTLNSDFRLNLLNLFWMFLISGDHHS
jgi:hypothetical protein